MAQAIAVKGTLGDRLLLELGLLSSARLKCDLLTLHMDNGNFMVLIFMNGS